MPESKYSIGGIKNGTEIFAGAVQDYGIGTIVGTTTFGKGVVLDQPREMPEYLESGTQNVPGILALGAGMDFVRTNGTWSTLRGGRGDNLSFKEDGRGKNVYSLTDDSCLLHWNCKHFRCVWICTAYKGFELYDRSCTHKYFSDRVCRIP